MNSLVVGMGEIGTAVSEVVRAFDIVETYDRRDSEMPSVGNLDVLHICFPYSLDFVADVTEYIQQFAPTHVVVWSTVQIGATRAIGPNVAHSPVEGKHPDLAFSILKGTRWVGANTQETREFFEGYFARMGMDVMAVPSTETTEFLKLRSTSKYGINIAWAEYEKQVSDQLGISYEYVKMFDMDYNRLYKTLGLEMYQRYILEPPSGPIGGHCVVPNAKLLNEIYPSDMLEQILKVGK